MKKRDKRREKKSDQILSEKKSDQVLQTMRGLVQAARVPYTRRLISPAKAMEAVRLTAQRGIDDVREVHHRQRRGGQVVSEDGNRRIKADQRAMPRQVLSSQVRQLYYDARRALVCQSRADRREVLFALQKTGKNGNRNRTARWTDLSYVSCKKRG